MDRTPGVKHGNPKQLRSKQRRSNCIEGGGGSAANGTNATADRDTVSKRKAGSQAEQGDGGPLWGVERVRRLFDAWIVAGRVGCVVRSVSRHQTRHGLHLAIRHCTADRLHRSSGSKGAAAVDRSRLGRLGSSWSFERWRFGLSARTAGVKTPGGTGSQDEPGFGLFDELLMRLLTNWGSSIP